MEYKTTIKIHNFNGLGRLSKQVDELTLLSMSEEWVDTNLCILHARCALSRQTNVEYQIDFELVPTLNRLSIWADKETHKVLEYFNYSSFIRLLAHVDSERIRNMINLSVTERLLNKLT